MPLAFLTKSQQPSHGLSGGCFFHRAMSITADTTTSLNNQYAFYYNIDVPGAALSTATEIIARLFLLPRHTLIVRFALLAVLTAHALITHPTRTAFW